MRLKYLVPNLITCSSIVFGLVAVERALRGRIVDGVWWNLLCVGTDKLDGAAAKALDAGSDFGVQLDSLADLVTFGVAPAVLFLSFYGGRWPELALIAVCAVWLCAVAIRLARFNLRAAAGGAAHYSGAPSTMAAGMVLTAFLTALKYAGSQQPWQILPLHTEAIVDWVPLLLLVGAAGMLSPLKVPRIGRTRHLATTVILFALMAAGLLFGLVRRMPEYLLFGGLVWLAISFRYHFRPPE